MESALNTLKAIQRENPPQQVELCDEKDGLLKPRWMSSPR